MRKFNVILAMAVIGFVIFNCAVSFALVTPADIHIGANGQLKVDGWFRMREIDYGFGKDYTDNTVTASGAGWVEYENTNLSFRKEYELLDDVLTVTLYITPRNTTGLSCKLETNLDFASQGRKFTQWYSAYMHAYPDTSGIIFDANPGGADWNFDPHATGYNGCSVFVSPTGSLMFDRIQAGGYVVLCSIPAIVASDLSNADWPLYTHTYAEFSPAQMGTDAGRRDNRFSYTTSVNTLVYKFNFIDTADAKEAVKLASQAYHGDRKALNASCYPGYESVSKPPTGPIASTHMIAANWGGPTSGINGAVAETAKANLQKFRVKLDDAGLASYELYFWIMLYELATSGGWGDLPTPEIPAPLSNVSVLNDLRDLYVDLKATIPNLKVGLYVHPWAAWEKSRVYTTHPTWFRSRTMGCDGGGNAYFGKLPEWGRHYYDQSLTPAEASIQQLITSYGLDFVFFDAGCYMDAYSGDLGQMSTYFTNLVQACHDAGAIAISNALNPYMDMNYLEHVAGYTSESDNFFVDSYDQIYTQPRANAPLTYRLGKNHLHGIPSLFSNGWTNDPGWVPCFPVHFSDDLVGNGYQQWVDILRTRHYTTDSDAVRLKGNNRL